MHNNFTGGRVMMYELSQEELAVIEGGCGWCYVGGVLVVAGGFVAAGIPGAALAALGVVGVLLT